MLTKCSCEMLTLNQNVVVYSQTQGIHFDHAKFKSCFYSKSYNLNQPQFVHSFFPASSVSFIENHTWNYPKGIIKTVLDCAKGCLNAETLLREQTQNSECGNISPSSHNLSLLITCQLQGNATDEEYGIKL